MYIHEKKQQLRNGLRKIFIIMIYIVGNPWLIIDTGGIWPSVVG
jgi:hypothetical protein